MEFKNLKVAILGLGETGTDAAVYLRRQRAHVFVSELKTSAEFIEKKALLEIQSVEVELGRHTIERILDSELVVVSPGISPKTEIYQAVKSRKDGAMISEIELASRLFPGEIIAVTGTNGKTTVTSMIAALFEHFGQPAVACGNIGDSFIGEMDRMSPKTKAVVEVSSFQLENIKHFRPHVAVLLNITPDHLDWHGTMEAYVSAKEKIFLNQQSNDFAILNGKDEWTKRLVSSIRSRVLYFNESGAENPNWDAALKVSEIYGFRKEETLAFFSKFPSIEHRLEGVPSKDSFRYLNDSKSTNPSSLEWALQRMGEKVILIAGGRNKGNDFATLASLVKEKVKHAILFGESREELKRAWGEVAQCSVTSDLHEAMRCARAFAERGDAILFSPGCASFDQFKNYKERGLVFKSIVSRQLS